MWPAQPIWLQPARVSALNILGDPGGGHLLSAARRDREPGAAGLLGKPKTRPGCTELRQGSAEVEPPVHATGTLSSLRAGYNHEFEPTETISFLNCTRTQTT